MGVYVCVSDVCTFEQAQDYKLVSIKMDISAPHIILPEDFKDKQTSLVSLSALIVAY